MAEKLNAQIRQRTMIYAPVEKVYDTITSAEEWDRFFTTGMRLDPKPGGICSFAWKDWGPDNYTLSVPGRTFEAERPRVFSFYWGEGDKESLVRFALEESDGGTLLTITESGYNNDEDSIRSMLECASGWGEAATLLKFYIERGVVYAPKN